MGYDANDTKSGELLDRSAWSVLSYLYGFVTYGFQFYLPPYFQAVQGSSPTKSGVEVMPTTLVIVVLAAIGGPLLSFWGKYKMHSLRL
jgi:hypothetical protein